MFPTALIIASAMLGGASAAHHAPPALNQLETARLPQAAQRLEFGVKPGEDQKSPFKFSFSDPVSLLPRWSCLSANVPAAVLLVLL